MKKEQINLLQLDKYRMEEEQCNAIYGGAPRTCTCNSCTCSCTVEPSTEWANTFNTNANTTGNSTLNSSGGGGGTT